MSHVVQNTHQVTVTPDADIVASQEPLLRAILWQEIERGTTRLVVDLQHVEMVDSCGMGLLILAQNTLHAQGGELTVMNVSADLLRLFRLMRLDKHFTIIARPSAA